MEVWPSGAALRGEAPNRLMLRWLKTVVVSDGEKAPGRRQVGTGKANESESLLTCRNAQDDIETGVSNRPRDESGGCPLTGRAVSGMEATRARSAASVWNRRRRVRKRPARSGG